CHHHHHHDDDDDDDHDHEHHHDHDHEHHHDHDHEDHDHEHHHHHHDADEVFQSWGVETPLKYGKAGLEKILKELADENALKYGIVLRAKGIVPADDGSTWYEFDLTPGEYEIREGSADYTGRLCVIGSGLNEHNISGLFGV
ncbi:MAG: GTP-binding protein, partial [Lachnospiraceae bacterium]|nr:GTP-binding protein [Lachnospiraceae bacterium]